MKFTIDSQIFHIYPEVLFGVAVLHGIDNHGNPAELNQLLRNTETTCLESFGQIPVIEHPYIACWREAYRLFGAKPKDYPSSIENLVRRILKDESIRHINKLVDIYNSISLKHLLPVGGEDLEKIQGDITLTIATDQETPVILLGEKEARAPYPKEVIYKDELGTICRRWNWKEVDRTKLTENTHDAIIVIEALPPADRNTIQLGITELTNLVKQFCGGEVSATILNRQKPNLTFNT